MWLFKYSTGLAITVFVDAMLADSSGSVVGNGSGDWSCFTVVSCLKEKIALKMITLRKKIIKAVILHLFFFFFSPGYLFSSTAVYSAQTRFHKDRC